MTKVLTTEIRCVRGATVANLAVMLALLTSLYWLGVVAAVSIGRM